MPCSLGGSLQAPRKKVRRHASPCPSTHVEVLKKKDVGKSSLPGIFCVHDWKL